MGHVRAHDQQHQADGAQEDQQPLPRSARDGVAEPDDRRRGVAIGGGKRHRQAGRDPAHVGARVLERHARPQPSEHVEIVGAALGFQIPRREAERHPELRLQWEGKAGRHDPHDLPRDAVDLQQPADDAGVGPEAPGPQPVTEHHHVAAAHAIVVGGQDAAQLRLRSKDGEEPARDLRAWHLLRRAAARERVRPFDVRRQLGEPAGCRGASR